MSAGEAIWRGRLEAAEAEARTFEAENRKLREEVARLTADKETSTAQIEEAMHTKYERYFDDERERIFTRVRAVLMWVPKDNANRQWLEAVDKGAKIVVESRGDGTRTPCSYHKGFKEDCGCA